MYPIPNTRMNVLKSQLMGVSCMKDASPGDGSKSMYEEKSNATTMVTTNGTENMVRNVSCSKDFGHTVVRHGLTEWWPDAEHYSREDVLVAGD